MQSQLAEPFGSLVNLILGPFGALIVVCVGIYFLWKLYREATTEARKAQDHVTELTAAINKLTSTTAEAQTSAVNSINRETQTNRELIKELIDEVREWRRERARA